MWRVGPGELLACEPHAVLGAAVELPCCGEASCALCCVVGAKEAGGVVWIQDIALYPGYTWSSSTPSPLAEALRSRCQAASSGHILPVIMGGSVARGVGT